MEEGEAFVVTKQDVLQKIGVNLLLFQQLEVTLKCLLSHRRISGYSGQLDALREQHLASIQRLMMGQLAGQVLNAVFSSAEAVDEQPVPADEPEHLTGVWISVSCTIQLTSSQSEEMQQSLASVVAERNELVHHLLANIDLESPEGVQAAARRLDRQQEKARALFTLLEGLATGVEQFKKDIAEYLGSEEGRKQVALWFIPACKLVELLRDSSLRKTRPDGWIELATVGHLMRQSVPDEVATLKERYGERTLKALLLATELFDICEEPMPSGGSRILCRAKPEYAER